MALLDLVLVNIYVVWKLVHNGTPNMKKREEFYHALAEEMYFYKGLDEVVRTRSHARTFQTSSPTANQAKARNKSGRDLRPASYDGHDFATLMPKPRKTRAKMKLQDDYKYGNGGRGFRFRFCFALECPMSDAL